MSPMDNQNSLPQWMAIEWTDELIAAVIIKQRPSPSRNNCRRLPCKQSCSLSVDETTTMILMTFALFAKKKGHCLSIAFANDEFHGFFVNDSCWLLSCLFVRWLRSVGRKKFIYFNGLINSNLMKLKSNLIEFNFCFSNFSNMFRNGWGSEFSKSSRP